jgi:hypothetical protein
LILDTIRYPINHFLSTFITKPLGMRTCKITLVIVLLLALPFALIAQHNAKRSRTIMHTKNAFAAVQKSFEKMGKHIPVAEFKSSVQIARSKFSKRTRIGDERHKRRDRVRSRSEVFVMMQFSVKTRERD